MGVEGEFVIEIPDDEPNFTSVRDIADYVRRKIMEGKIRPNSSSR
jgi:hypothetical protein